MNQTDLPSFAALRLGTIRPEGWLEDQLRLQASGLTGALEEIFPDCGPSSAWLGGDGEDWERGPYYLDGLVPLAHALNDELLLTKAQRWVEAILASQRPDGFFGPASNDDWWPRMVALKALAQHQDATGDDRVLELMEAYFRHQLAHLPTRPLRDWGQARGADNALVALWFKDRSPQPFLDDLIDLLLRQTLDWNAYLTRDLLEGPATRFDHRTHVVNVAMGLRGALAQALCTGSRAPLATFQEALVNLDRHHGLVTGIFSGDEWLAGTASEHGVELCAVVEFLHTLEEAVRIFGDLSLGDRIERVAYNALASHLSADLRSHQYHQQTNQVWCSVARRNWTFSSDDANTFGLEPHFGCCTANLHQGWPKLVRSLWQTGDDTLAPVAYAPSRATASVAGTTVSIRTRTDYPFGDRVTFEVDPAEPATFSLALRIPGWCRAPELRVGDGPTETPAGPVTRLHRQWRPGDRVELRLPMTPEIVDRPSGAVSVLCGPWVMALSPGEIWERIPGSAGFGDYEVRARQSWNFGLVPFASGEVQAKLHPVTAPPVGIQMRGRDVTAPVTVRVAGRPVPGWRLQENSAGPVPNPAETSMPTHQLDLVPFGCARIRVAEFPTVAPEIS